MFFSLLSDSVFRPTISPATISIQAVFGAEQVFGEFLITHTTHVNGSVSVVEHATGTIVQKFVAGF